MSDASDIVIPQARKIGIIVNDVTHRFDPIELMTTVGVKMAAAGIEMPKDEGQQMPVSALRPMAEAVAEVIPALATLGEGVRAAIAARFFEWAAIQKKGPGSSPTSAPSTGSPPNA